MSDPNAPQNPYEHPQQPGQPGPYGPQGGHPQQPGQPGPYGAPGGYPQQPPAGTHPVQPGQPGHAPYGQPLTHAQARAQARGAQAQAKAMRPWYKKKRFILPLALVALFVIIGIGGGGNNQPAPVAGAPATSTEAGSTTSDEPASDPTKEPTKKAAPQEAKIGDSVKAGDWQFKVTDFDCGKSKVGDQYLGKKAQGQFCLLKITAKNNSDSEGTVSGDSQKLSDDDGKTYSSDLEASLYDDPNSTLFLEGVNPGNTAKGTVIFDVPKSVKITSVTLTGGGLFDGEAKVSLR